jgi:plastocyanin
LDSYVKNSGGGLLTIGGENAYNETDMDGSLFENMLPVESKPSAQPLSLMLIIDASSSMTGGGGTAGTAGAPGSLLWLAKQGAKDCIDALKDEDYVSVISFADAPNTRVVLELTPATEKTKAKAAVDSIVSNTGTTYNQATYFAQRILNIYNVTPRKHVIFLTDGDPQDPDLKYLDYINTMYNEGITLSAIGVGGASAATINRLAQAGHGKAHFVNNAAELPAIMKEETATLVPKRENSLPLTPTAGDVVDATVGVKIEELPGLGGFYSTRAKPDLDANNAKKVRVGLSVKALDAMGEIEQSTLGKPLYAEWSYGMGKVGSFTGRLDGLDAWSSGFYGNDESEKFMAQMVRSLMPKSSAASSWATATVYPDDNEKAEIKNNEKLNYTKKISVKTNNPNETTLNPGDTITAVITDKDSNRQTITLQAGDSNTAVGYFRSRTVGVYRIDITRQRANGVEDKMSTFSTMSYSQEYDTFGIHTEGADNMASLAEAGKGRVLVEAGDAFAPGSEDYVYPKDPRLGFLIAMVALFLLDIAARKFKFKWPWEIVRARREKKAAAAASSGL